MRTHLDPYPVEQSVVRIFQEDGGPGSPPRGACTRASIRIRRVLVGFAAAAASILLAACGDSNDVAGPNPVGVYADLSGDWSGHYDSNVPSLCTSGGAVASLRQDGNQVRGTFKAAGCGIAGAIRGTVTGNLVNGTVEMLGCTGGAVSGRLEAGQLTFAIGDFQKVLLTGDAEVLPGGQARLQQ